jgi:hypothetical protein
MVFRRGTSLAVKLSTLIVVSAGIIFVLMILFNYSFLKDIYIAQARETAQLLSESKAQKVSLILATAEGVAETLASVVSSGTHSEAELNQCAPGDSGGYLPPRPRPGGRTVPHFESIRGYAGRGRRPPGVWRGGL